MTADSNFAEIHDELRAVAWDLLGRASLQRGPDGRGDGGSPSPGTTIDWSSIARSGWLGLEVPEALDGAGVTFAEVAVVLEEMGRAATPGPYLGTAVLGVGALNLLAPNPNRDDLLRLVASGERVLAVALSSGGHHDLPAPESDGQQARTATEVTIVGSTGTPFRLERSADRLHLHGHAAFVPDAPEADRLLLLAHAPDGEPVIVVTHALAETPDNLEVTAQPLLDTTRRVGIVTATGAEVNEMAVWRFAADPEASTRWLLNRGAVAVACDSLGLSQAMLNATVAYAGARHQFGRPIGSFQAVKHACADMLVQISVGRELVAAAVHAAASDDPDAALAVSRAKSYVCAVAVDIVGKALQLHGGIGYTWESGIHTYLKRAALNRSLFGSPIVHRKRLAARLTHAA